MGEEQTCGNFVRPPIRGKEDNMVIMQAIDDLTDENLESVICNFVVEKRLVKEFLIWIEKWKISHKLVKEREA